MEKINIWNDGFLFGKYGLFNKDKILNKTIKDVEHIDEPDEEKLKIIFSDDSYLLIEISEFGWAHYYKESEKE